MNTRARSRDSVIDEGRTVWRRAHAGRGALLLDGAAYFGALRSSLLQARRSVLIAGWDIDSRLRLVGATGTAGDSRPDTFRALLENLVEDRPELEARLLLWDYSMLYALEREPLTALKLNWPTPARLQVEMDDCLPLGGAHHQKIAVIDDSVAYCGGLDLTTHRWDTREHRPGDDRRTDPGGEIYPPFHDVQMVVDGEAAAALGELLRERWRRCTDGPCFPEGSGGRGGAPAPWPEGVRPDFEDMPVGIARTAPSLNDGDPAVEEVRALYLESIRAARKSVYIENQYFTAPDIGDALAERMRAVPGLEAVVVAPRRPGGWLEEKTMGAGQARIMERFDDGLQDRIRFCYPFVREGEDESDVMVHAKLMVVDDRILRVGSSNLNRRSMGLDTECDLVIEAESDETRGRIRAVLARLLAHHLGEDAEAIRGDLESGRPLTGIVDERGGPDRCLRPLDPATEHVDALSDALNSVADRERPLEPGAFMGDMFGGQEAGEGTSRIRRAVAVLGGILALVAVWKFSPLSEWADPETVATAFESLRTSGWAEAALFAAFIAGGLVMFPLTVLVAVTGMILGPWSGFGVAMAGALASASLSYVVGHRMGQRTLEGLVGGRRVRAVRRALGAHGVITVAALRNVPVAPYTVVNVVLGALGLGFGVFVAGTFAGLLPGILALTVLGDRFARLWQDPDPVNLVLLVAVVAAWIALAAGLQRLIARLRKSA